MWVHFYYCIVAPLQELSLLWWSSETSHKHFGSTNVICGSISGLYVLDVDPRNGGNLDGKSLPKGPLSKTLNGGRHHFFHSEMPLSKRQGILRGVDFVGEGSYVVLPPSFGGYEWLHELDEDLPDLPRWVIGLVLSSTRHHKTKTKGREGGQRESPDNQVRFLPDLNAACIKRKLHWPLAIWAEFRAFDHHCTKGRGFIPGSDGCNHLLNRGFSQRIVLRTLLWSTLAN